MMLLDIVFYSFVVVVCIQVVYYAVFYGSFAFSKPSKTQAKNISVSVIICAKNEAENLKEFLPSILNQDFPDFEVVLINDASSDSTLAVMQAFKAEHKQIKIVDVKNIEAFWAKKKYALTLGIKAAKNDYLLFTDADCKALTNQWINEMAAHFTDKSSIVLGYGAYSKSPRSFLNKLIRYETLLTAIQYFSFAKIGSPFMGVGRNLAYHRSEFLKTDGFIKHIDIRSGDDDLFINEAANGNNTRICFTKNSFTESHPKTTYNDWFRQKRRHISTAGNYRFIHKAMLALFYISQFLFWLFALVLLIPLFYWKFVLLLILFRFLIQYVVFSFSAEKLQEKDLLIFLPFLEVFTIIFQLTIFITNLISKPNHWK